MQNVVIGKHNIDDSPNRPSQFGIRGIPTMLLFKNGEVIAQKVGATTKSNIVSWIKEHIQFKFNISPAKYKLPVQRIIALVSSFAIFFKADWIEASVFEGMPQD